MTYPVKSPRKLIEVALPLNAINLACAREKAIKHGHPSALHLWWARRPLAAARAVLFAQMVNDPSWKWDLDHTNEVPPNHLKASWAASRKRLFSIIEDLVKWEGSIDLQVLDRARVEIRRSWLETCELNKDHPEASQLFNPEKIPAVHDPFAGGGTIPLEAQRLGLETFASDLNPVAVLINKAMIEIPSIFANYPPISLGSSHGKSRKKKKTPRMDFEGAWSLAAGLAEDIRNYGAWMVEQAKARIGNLYPSIEITDEVVKERPDLATLLGKKLTVTAWLWARTVKSPNPAFSHVDVPLVSNFVLSSKKGKEVYVQPIIKGDQFSFSVRVGEPPPQAFLGTSAGKRQAFRCVVSNSPIDYEYIRREGKAGRIKEKLMAIVAEGSRNRIYLSPKKFMEDIVGEITPTWKPDCEMPQKHRNFQPPVYGMNNFGDLFSPRQLVALTTFCDLVSEVRNQILRRGTSNSFPIDDRGLEEGGRGIRSYADAVSLYLSFGISKLLDRCCSLVTWFPQRDSIYHVFGRQALPMTWDFAEANPLNDGAGSFLNTVNWVAEVIESFRGCAVGFASQADAQSQRISEQKIVSTDPPYYDNINYADLSDFFYVWLRRSLKNCFPLLLSTISVPKAEELVASQNRHGSKDNAEKFFLDGMSLAMTSIASQVHPAVPTTIYYAFKQSEKKGAATPTSTGWETFLEAVIRAGFMLSGTWPMRTELGNRLVGKEANALASSIILVCRRRASNAPTISRRGFIQILNQVLPEALDEMTKGSGEDCSPVAPVDLSQAIIGPGMAIFSKYSAVLEADGSHMSVRTALQLINRFLAEDDFDHDTQFCLHWFEQNGWHEGQFGQADVLARAKATSVDGLASSGVISSGAGKVRLRRWAEYPTVWDPTTDKRCPIWEALHQLIRSLKNEGESQAGRLLAEMSSKAEPIRQLAYRLYTLCERRGWAEDARAYNELITSWSGIEAASTPIGKTPEQMTFDEIDEGIKS